ncbi:hypothetical protein HFP15_13535 [Amycolatopsis sp. K13G38]|uniref:Uncharacterized protein n=1 Tax=Amycolatopsis acididurans TaxID=2724524 RepID=A0ABX1J2B1_9PSEU|nr:hypothetical protein [Amycolatopsis acididurans]NKQ53903.1 hypothetical protein [Amycolatopsis acididurans]
MPDAGYSYDPNGLTQVNADLGAARDELAAVGNQQITAPDAGASSDVVANAIAGLIGAAVGAASLAEEIGGNVNIANGAYGAYENNQAGATLREQEEVQGDNAPIATGPM